MTDINIETAKALSELDCPVNYQYPDTFSALPTVSYYNLTERGAFWADNEECIQSGYVQIDIWARIPSECGELSAKINDAMTRNGWTREMSGDVPKKDEKIYHRTMRFQKYFNV